MLEVLRSGQLSLGPRVPAVRAGVRRARRRAARERRRRAARPGLHLALRAAGVEDGDEVVTSPFSFVASANARCTSARGRCSPTSTRCTLNLDPAGGRRGRDDAHDGAAAGAHLRLPGRHAGVRALAAAWPAIVEDACEALGARPRRRHAGRRARPPGRVRLLRQQAADDGRGRDGHARRRGAEGAHRLRAQPGPGAGHGLARPRPARLQLPPLATSRARSGSPSSSGSTRCSPAARASPRCYREALAGIEGLGAAVRGRRRRRARLVRVRRAAAARRRPRRRSCAALRERGRSRASPTCRRST